MPNRPSAKLRAAYADLDRVLRAGRRIECHARDPTRSVGRAMQVARRQVLRRALADLHALGFTVLCMRNLAPRHLRALVPLWRARGNRPGEIQRKCAILRWLGRLLGKPGLVPPLPELFADPQVYRRVAAARAEAPKALPRDALPEALTRIAAVDRVMAVQMLLCVAFGLRVREALCFRPHAAVQGDDVVVRRGRDGALARLVPIRLPFQHAVLALARGCAPTPQACTIPGDPYALSVTRAARRLARALRRHAGASTRLLTAAGYAARQGDWAALAELGAALAPAVEALAAGTVSPVPPPHEPASSVAVNGMPAPDAPRPDAPPCP